MSGSIRAVGIGKLYGLSPVQSLGATLRRWLGRGRPAGGGDGMLWALRDATFALGPGETLGVIGPNGAGKTTLLKILCGVTEATVGELDVQGRVAPLIEVGAGFHPELTGRENILFNAAILGMRPDQIRRKLDAIVAFSELEAFLDVPVKKYSSGMFVRLGFSVAVHTDPDLLLVDEVLAVGDANFQRKCLERIRELVRGGCGLVIVSHSLMSVEAVARRVLWLDHGRVRQDGPADAVIMAYSDEMNRRYAETRRPGSPDPGSPVVLEKLVMRDAEGRETDAVASLSSLDLDIHYLAQTRIERPFFWLGVAHEEHGSLFGVCNIDPLDRPAFIQGQGHVRVHIPSLPLMPGVYQITGGVRDETASVLLAPSRFLGTLRVEMTSPGRLGDTSFQTGLAYQFSPVIVPAVWRRP